MFQAMGRWCYRNYWYAIGAWIAAVALLGVISTTIVGSAYNGEFSIPESQSADGFALIEEHYPDLGASGFMGSIVFRAEQGVDDPEVMAAMQELFEFAEGIDGVAVTTPYELMGAVQINDDRTVAYAELSLDASLDQTETGAIGADLAERLPVLDGLTIEIGGAALAEFAPPKAELIGLAFAIVVLIVSFGSVLAMGLPIGVALFGVGMGAGLTMLASRVVAIPDLAPTVGAMIGLGVGIDYALFIVTRYREATASGLDREAAIIRAMDTAGRAVAFAGVTVVISLMGMTLMGVSFISGLGIGASLTVATTLASSLTLLPAFVGLAGDRIERTRYRGLVAAGLVSVALLGAGLGHGLLIVIAVPAALAVLALGSIPQVPWLGRIVPRRPPKPIRDTFPYRWAQWVQHHPIVGVIVGVVVLGVMALPVLGLRLGFSDEGNYSPDTTTRRAYDLLADGFGAGVNGPLIVITELDGPGDFPAFLALVDAIAADRAVASVSPPFPNDLSNPMNSTAALVRVLPISSPQDETTTRLVERLREEIIPAAAPSLSPAVTGSVPSSIDFTAFLVGRLGVFFGVVLALSFVVLMMVFRSVLVPLKAVIMNLLSIGAAYGVVVAVFQWGWGASLIGIEPAPIEPFVPMMLFAIVFGLSMDYEVFLLSRIKEEFDHHRDPVNSVSDGLAATARVITAAAAIMVVVFGSFLFEENRIIKLFGVGLAVAVLLDATLVRMLLVPATMRLLGTKNWWLPRWLDRILPSLNVEGPSR